MNIKCRSRFCCALLVLKIGAQSFVKLRACGIILVIQLEQPFVADHIGRKLGSDLFQDIGQGNIVKMMDP